MARFLSKAAIVAAALCCATAAQATTNLTYTLNLTGTGNRFNQFPGGPNGSEFLNQTLIGAIITFSFDVPDDFQTSAGSNSNTTIFGVSSTAQALNFGFSPVTIQSFEFNTGSGTACFATPQNGFLPEASVQIMPACGSVSFTSAHPRGLYTDTFTGTVTSLTVLRQAGSGFSTFSAIGVIPEPSTWALMLAGFAMTGYTLRKRRVSVALVPTA